jgi:predicted alpha/beta hydrolase family esterase
MNAIVFNIPGLSNSGPQHWQTHWENEYGFVRINQKDWETPECTDWIITIDKQLEKIEANKIILVAHSLGCCAVIHWAKRYYHIIKGALLVAPSDVEGPSYPPGTRDFNPMPLYRLPFPSIVVASTNDEYVTIERAKYFADSWGSEFVNIGECRHINSASNLGNWPEGHEWLLKLDKEPA